MAPVLIGVPILVATRKRFPMTPLAYRLAFALCLLLALGAHFTFSRVPLGFWLERHLGLSRNPYDRIVHFAAGVTSAVLGRELVKRKTRLSDTWIFFVVALGCLGGAAIYEFLEWGAAVWSSEARAFVASQGDRWDAQWDMLTTFSGAIASLWAFRRVQDREISILGGPSPIDLTRGRPTSEGRKAGSLA